MPTYDYRCESCGHEFEVFQSMKDDRLTDCPLDECSGAVKRLLGTGAGIIFKGSGFYETDYRSDSYKKAAKADSTQSDGGSSSGSEKSSGSDKGSSKSDSSSKAPAPKSNNTASKSGD
ncbi:MAG: FmdB family zinc ribbon protein [Verrucomicrobiota bacterium]